MYAFLPPSTIPSTAAGRLSDRMMSQFKPKAADGTVIAIGASTGGTEAILEVLKQFSPHMPGIVITQHMPAGFTAMYAERLNRLCRLEVREAKNGDRLHPGLALLAPGGLQMRLVRMGQAMPFNVWAAKRWAATVLP